MTTFFLDPVAGSDAGAGTSFALRWKTIGSGATAARIAPGDTIKIMQSRNPGSLGSVTWADASNALTLGAAKTQNVWKGDEAWTAVSANVTGSTSTTNRKIGATSNTAAIASAFTTGKVAYKTITSLDLSAYQQIAFWAYSTVLATGMELRLCTDTIGDTAVHTIPIVLSGSNRWAVALKDFAGALNAAIQSVSLWATTDPVTPTVRIQNIIACKTASDADCLTLLSLIGKETGGEPEMNPIQSIDGTAVVLGSGPQSGLGSGDITSPPWYGTSEAVTTYAVNPVDISLLMTTTAMRTVQDAGTLGSPIIFSGGWDTTDMSTQPGHTWWSSSYAVGEVVICSQDFIEFDDISVAHGYDYGLRLGSSTPKNVSFTGKGAVGCGVGVSIAATASEALNGLLKLNLDQLTRNQYGINRAGPWQPVRGIVGSMRGNNEYGIISADSYAPMVLRVPIIKGNRTGGILLNLGSAAGPPQLTLIDAVMSSNTVDVNSFSNSPIAARLIDCTLSSATDISNGSGYTSRILSQRHGGTALDDRIYAPNWTAQTDAVVRHTASDVSWRLNPLHATACSAAMPAVLPLATVVCAGAALVTFKAWLRRSHASLTLGLRVRGGFFQGIGTPLADVQATMTAAADTWEEVTLTFTPTDPGGVEIEVFAYGGTTYAGYVDDISVTQA